MFLDHLAVLAVVEPKLLEPIVQVCEHLPLLAATRAGLLKYRAGGHDQVAAIGPGFVEALPDRVLLLTDAYLTPANIDRGAAEQELAAAERALAETKSPLDSAEHKELTRDLEWARARVEAVRS